MGNHGVEQYPLPTLLRSYLDPAIDAGNLVEFKKEIRKVSALMLREEERTQDENECLEFLEEFLNQVYKMYKSPVDYDANEDAFNQLYTWPYLDLIGNSINTEECKGYFIQGQPILQSMDQQLKATGVSVDDKSQYKTDGVSEQAVRNITGVKNEHQENSSKFRYNPEDYTQLSSIVNPVIIKLTKKEDSTGMGNLDPMYSPPHY
ncbi:hypothetical protein HMPREF1544_10251 [Mucor circinelloides 1006PhL]|uniref:Uncharacterized protein n=1 Tax=Mucor circinelloides f. circinelloides (strain 1006PhL) TaxID=1220926 RepID=S2IZ08_MUCC1|nr:hypothetical protein HMPREF1544_10251 [Mucor circinelloides 1006PhL]